MYLFKEINLLLHLLVAIGHQEVVKERSLKFLDGHDGHNAVNQLTHMPVLYGRQVS